MSIEWNVIIGQLVTAILKIVLPITIAWILSKAAELWLKIKESNPNIAYLLECAAQLGYANAEEHYRGQQVDGYKKLDYAIERAESYLSENGLKVDLNVVKDAIIAYGVDNDLFHWQHKEDESNAANK